MFCFVFFLPKCDQNTTSVSTELRQFILVSIEDASFYYRKNCSRGSSPMHSFRIIFELSEKVNHQYGLLTPIRLIQDPLCCHWSDFGSTLHINYLHQVSL